MLQWTLGAQSQFNPSGEIHSSVSNVTREERQFLLRNIGRKSATPINSVAVTQHHWRGANNPQDYKEEANEKRRDNNEIWTRLEWRHALPLLVLRQLRPFVYKAASIKDCYTVTIQLVPKSDLPLAVLAVLNWREVSVRTMKTRTKELGSVHRNKLWTFWLTKSCCQPPPPSRQYAKQSQKLRFLYKPRSGYTSWQCFLTLMASGWLFPRDSFLTLIASGWLFPRDSVSLPCWLLAGFSLVTVSLPWWLLAGFFLVTVFLYLDDFWLAFSSWQFPYLDDFWLAFPSWQCFLTLLTSGWLFPCDSFLTLMTSGWLFPRDSVSLPWWPLVAMAFSLLARTPEEGSTVHCLLRFFVLWSGDQLGDLR